VDDFQFYSRDHVWLCFLGKKDETRQCYFLHLVCYQLGIIALVYDQALEKAAEHSLLGFIIPFPSICLHLKTIVLVQAIFTVL
jgi:hypothetical protein